MDIKVIDVDSISLNLASPEKILSWSQGEVTKPETINYRTQRAERNGLFCEKIFGPEKDWECYCGKYRRVRYKGIVCEKCGVEVTRSIVRRERMGHISLAVPVSHVWFLKGVPSYVSILLETPASQVEKVMYFAGYIITKVNESAKEDTYKNLEIEYKAKLKTVKTVAEKDALKKAYTSAKSKLDGIILHKIIDQTTYHLLSIKFGDVFEVSIGAEAIYNIFKSMDLEKEIASLEERLIKSSAQERTNVTKKLNILQSLYKNGSRPEYMFLTVIPVIPPALRPMVPLDGGRHATSDLNDLYRRVINRNNRLKKLAEIHAPEVICRNEKRILQEAVDSLIDNSSAKTGGKAAFSQSQRRPLKSLAGMLKGKQGRFRQNLLGKRVDYSGRSVIVVGPELHMHQCGLPKHMALEIFKPFVIAELLERELAYNIRGANRLIDEKIVEVWAILEEVIKGKHVLLNRAPTLHRLGIQAFQPILIEGNAIQVHPLVCAAFNADFDGDQMAVHLPLSEEAQKESAEIMASVKNLLLPGSGDPIVNPSQDIVLGCYWMTTEKAGAKGEGKAFSSPNDAITAHDFEEVDLRAKIKVLPTSKEKYKIFDGKVFETTVGRLLFNSILPSDLAYINKSFGKKDLGKLVLLMITRYGVDATPDVLDKIKKLGFEYSTKSGISWGMNDLVIPKEKPEIIAEARKADKNIQEQFDRGLLTERERYNKVIEIWQKAKDEVEAKVPSALDPEGTVYTMVNSKARSSWSVVAQMAGMKGLMVNPSGKIIDFPVIPSYKEGLSVLEYFITTHGARKGSADTSLKTAQAGYLTRRLVDVAQEIIVREEDCGEKDGIVVTKHQADICGKDFNDRLTGRTLSEDIAGFKKGTLLTAEEAKQITDSGAEDVKIFSPITCLSKRGVCQKCYGYDLGFNLPVKLGEAVGVVAAQAIGEPGTQLTMRTFHGGGISAGGDITMGLPRVTQIFELITPPSSAVIAEADGTVAEIREEEGLKLVTVLSDKGSEKEKESIEYKVSLRRFITVKVGDNIKKGQSLTDGSYDIKNYYKIAGIEAAQEYILNEINKVYSLQGATINEKHIEVIIRQMFSRVKVTNAGSTKFTKDDVVADFILNIENEKVKAEGGELAKSTRMVMSVKNVALTSPSFLSAASFQNTVKVLVKSVIKGAKDDLLGLKENVIIGRMIPAGTGFKKKEE